MAISIIPIDDFLRYTTKYPVLDVRSPGEHAHAHIPGAYSLPLFTDNERAEIGTAYRHEHRDEAIKIGLRAFGPRMKDIIESVEDVVKKHKRPAWEHGKGKVLIHCWRGGMRSAAVAWLLDLYGFHVYQLEGGYKEYRRWVLRKIDRAYNFKVIGGSTGAGKTAVLQALHKSGYCVLDLEQLAEHKGSAFGGLHGIAQPGQEQFENNLAERLYQLTAIDPGRTIYVEDESQRIGTVNLPAGLYQAIRQARQFFLDVPFEARLDYILKEYGPYPIEALVNAIVRIKKRLGPLETKTAVSYLIEGDVRSCFSILLQYYDKQYRKALETRGSDAAPIDLVSCQTVDVMANTRSLIMQLMGANAVT